MISKIEYIDSYIGTDKEYIVNEANILLKNKNKVFYNFDGINSEQTLTQYLTGKFIYLDEYKKNNENIMISFDDLKDLTMEIVYYDDEIKNTIIIPLKLTKQYSDTKLFY